MVTERPVKLGLRGGGGGLGGVLFDASVPRRTGIGQDHDVRSVIVAHHLESLDGLSHEVSRVALDNHLDSTDDSDDRAADMLGV
jgi:hypothetical protein